MSRSWVFTCSTRALHSRQSSSASIMTREPLRRCRAHSRAVHLHGEVVGPVHPCVGAAPTRRGRDAQLSYVDPRSSTSRVRFQTRSMSLVTHAWFSSDRFSVGSCHGKRSSPTVRSYRYWPTLPGPRSPPGRLQSENARAERPCPPLTTWPSTPSCPSARLRPVLGLTVLPSPMRTPGAGSTRRRPSLGRHADRTDSGARMWAQERVSRHDTADCWFAQSAQLGHGSGYERTRRRATRPTFRMPRGCFRS